MSQGVMHVSGGVICLKGSHLCLSMENPVCHKGLCMFQGESSVSKVVIYVLAWKILYVSGVSCMPHRGVMYHQYASGEAMHVSGERGVGLVPYNSLK